MGNRFAVVLLVVFGALVVVLLSRRPSYTARLAHGAGLQAGSPVVARGLTVGEVKSVRLDGDRVRVEFSLDADQDVLLHEDACAFGIPSTETSTLLLMPGRAGEWDSDTALPQCELPSLAEAVGETGSEALKALVARVLETSPAGGERPGKDSPPVVQGQRVGSAAGTSQTDSPRAPAGGMPDPWGVAQLLTELGAPVPSPQPRPTRRHAPGGTAGGCDGIRVQVAGFEQVPPMPLLLPRGGMKVRLRIENHRDSAIEVPSSDRLRLMNSDREILPVAQVPGSGDWWMPFDVPAAASATVTVTVASTQPIAGGSIEIPGVREGGGSLFGRTCTVTGAF